MTFRLSSSFVVIAKREILGSRSTPIPVAVLSWVGGFVPFPGWKRGFAGNWGYADPTIPRAQSLVWPRKIAKMSAAFEAASAKLGLANRSDAARMAVAKLIIEFAKTGELDPERPCALAVQQLSK